MADVQTQLVLAQNQHAFIQDSTKGMVQVYSGPHASSLSPNDRPVVFDGETQEYTQVTQQKAIVQNPLVPEGHYLVLENPAYDGEHMKFPAQGINSPRDLKIGRKINIPGPTTFALWPGQFAESIPGHHLRSNQYLVVRVYNSDEANKSDQPFLKKEEKPFTPGQLLIIKGTESSFFIPPTGFEVLKENDRYVREALTLERLEYCILLDEDGNKRFEEGPQVVFPEATEQFQVKEGGNDRDGANPSGGGKSRKFKAIELNAQMGLYIKIIAEDMASDVKLPEGLKEGDEFYSSKYKATCVIREFKRNDKGAGEKVTLKPFFKVGEELFLTGKDRSIYYPRPEQALIQYDDPSQKGLKRERYYGITIPPGEGRYVLDKTAGTIKKEVGPQIFLPDPRNQVIVRRILDDKTVGLWYPGNQEALAFNRTLSSLSENSSSALVADSIVTAAAADIGRGMNRGTSNSKSLGNLSYGSFEGDKMTRGAKFTPPPMLTLDTKYDGIPAIHVQSGYAVQVVDKSGNRRIEIGPKNILLEYDESLEVFELSTGKPKTTDNLRRDVYLRVDNNLVSDIVSVETKDLVNVRFKLSYRVNFLRQYNDKWFSVENYVKFLCDHMRSILKGDMKKMSITQVMDDSSTLIRSALLGEKKGKEEPRVKTFDENGMELYDVEVLEVKIEDESISHQLQTARQNAVQNAITLAADEQSLVVSRRRTMIQTEISQLQTEVAIGNSQRAQETALELAKAKMAELESEIEEGNRRLEAQVAEQAQQEELANAVYERRKRDTDYELEVEGKRTELYVKKIEAVTPDLITAITNVGDNNLIAQLSTSLAPLAIHQQQGIGTTIEALFAGTPMKAIIDNISGRVPAKAGK